MKKYIILLSLLLLLPTASYAHSGGTDGNGGHNSSTGYHYHHGYPAHQHENGQCPYEFDDKTGWNSGSSSDGENNNKKNTVENKETSEQTSTPIQEKKVSPIAKFIGYAMMHGMYASIFFATLLLVYVLIFEIEPKNKTIITKLLNRVENFIFLPEEITTSPIYRNIKYHDCYAEPIGPKTFEEHVKENTTVYITKSGTRYHLQSCTMVKKNSYPVTLKAAEKHGYKPCSKCNPPE